MSVVGLHSSEPSRRRRVAAVAGQRRAVVTTSWDDGHPLDLRLAALLVRYGIPATFYIPRRSEVATMREADIRSLSQSFEIGAHTMNHKVLTQASDAEAWQEIAESKRWVEDVTGRDCVMFCPPTGRYARSHADMVRRAGFSGLRSAELGSIDAPRQDHGIFIQPTTVQAYPHALPAYARNALRRRAPTNLWRCIMHGRATDWGSLAASLMAEVERGGGVFHLWGHSWEIDEAGQWQRLDDVLRLLGDVATSIPAVTNGELCRRATAGLRHPEASAVMEA